MFLDLKKQFCQNVHTQINVHIHCNPYQKSISIFHKKIINSPKISMELQKTPKSQSNPKMEEQSWRHNTSWFQAILQSYSHQNHMVQAKKKKKKRHIDQENRGESPDIIPCINDQLIFKIFIWLPRVLVVAPEIFTASCRIFQCSMQAQLFCDCVGS